MLRNLKLFAGLLLTAVAPAALAHEGHGFGSGLIHEAQHAFWILAALMLAAAIYTSLRKGFSSTKTVKRKSRNKKS